MDKPDRADPAGTPSSDLRNTESLFDKVFVRDESSPLPAMVQRLNADLERVFYSTQKNSRAERKPATSAEESVPPAVCVDVCRVLNQALANCIDVLF